MRGVSIILIAEQDLSLRAQLADFLRRQGHHVAEARGGLEARQQLEHSLFEVILTDLRLPETSGSEILQTVHSIDQLTAVLMLIDPDDITSAFEVLKLGALD